VLVQEAGGQVSAYDQTPIDLSTGRILATNTHLHKALSTELLKVKPLTIQFPTP
jgi:myo-inositol-1(or 4)-monophosphatase